MNAANTTSTIPPAPKKPDKFIKILLPSFDPIADPPVLRGIISLESLKCLQVDTSYQRERLTPTARKAIISALENGKKLPDIELGMRGEKWDMPNNDEALLLDPTFIIDGYQRSSSVTEHMERFPNDSVRLGVSVHFNTTQAFERERFQECNMNRNRIAPSLILRNHKEKHALIAQLYGLSKANVRELMYGRVCWSQHQSRGELLSGLTFAQCAMILHVHLGPFTRTNVRDITDTSDRLERVVGLPLFRANIMTLWQAIDDMWGIRTVSQRDGAPYLKSTFLKVFTRFLSDHRDFWTDPDEKKFVFPSELKRRLGRFPMNDPEIIRLASAGGRAGETLYFQFVQFLNHNKRHRRLKNRHGTIVPSMMTTTIVSDDDEDSGTGIA